jgi:hypothetical protein
MEIRVRPTSYASLLRCSHREMTILRGITNGAFNRDIPSRQQRSHLYSFATPTRAPRPVRTQKERRAECLSFIRGMCVLDNSSLSDNIPRSFTETGSQSGLVSLSLFFPRCIPRRYSACPCYRGKARNDLLYQSSRDILTGDFFSATYLQGSRDSSKRIICHPRD